jgi:hypothetical protein
MDLSKLPRMSRTPPVPAESETPAAPAETSAVPTTPCPVCKTPIRVGARFCDSCGVQISSHGGGTIAVPGPEAWISIAVAAILLFMYPGLLKFLAHPHDTSALDAFDNTSGVTIPYTHSAFIWSDLGVTLFALILLIDAAVLVLFPRRIPLLIAAALSALVAVFNIGVVAHNTSITGFPVQCGLAVAFGIYMAFSQAIQARRT